MATAKKAFGSFIYRETTPSSGTYTKLGGVEGFNYPELSVAMTDTTDMDAASAMTTQIPTLGTLGDCSFDLFYDSSDATQEQLTADCVAQTVRTYRIIANDTGADVWGFSAYVKSIAVVANKGDSVKAKVVLAPTGAVTRY